MIILLGFRFHAQGAILGKLQEATNDQAGVLPYQYFLATKLLPCQSFQGNVQKFCGNDKLGIPTGSLEMAIHAFMHYVWLASNGNIFLCDLQG